MSASPPLFLGYYGDDFTGSTDVMEALTRAGIRTVLFLDPPRDDQLARFPGVKAVGVAGMARSFSPEQMEVELPSVFERLRALGAPIVHYKTCSTFDSSPEIGSIGRAIDLAQRKFRCPFVPLMVGAPVLGRYCVFGNLFARSGLDTEPFRLDRHPTMSRHPVTPMNEADLRVHLARQTDRPVGLLDILKLAGGPDSASEHLNALLKSGAQIVLFDVLDEGQLPIIGRLIDQHASGREPLFVVGSSGVEYALVAHWRQTGQVSLPRDWTGAGPTERILAVSGSCSPVTDRQIRWALEHGFAEVVLETSCLARPDEADGEMKRAVRLALDSLTEGTSVIVHTARGPDDPRMGKVRPGSAESMESAGRIGTTLGQIAQRILEATPLSRIAVAGGDTSGHVARELGIEALEMIGPMAPGSPLCRVYAAGRPADGMEIVFKGGQVGHADFFGSVLRGAP